MRLTKEQTAQNRAAILDAAARLFRERGLDGVGVADIMKAAGFTHGGFYNHFASKDALAAEVVAGTLGGPTSGLARAIAEHPDDADSGALTQRAWTRFVAQYLSPEHRDARETGCTLSALVGDAARSGIEVQSSFACGFEPLVAGLAALFIADGLSKTEARRRAIHDWSAVIGGLVLSRAIVDADPALADEILAANKKALG